MDKDFLEEFDQPELPFQVILDSLLDIERPIDRRFLYRLSDLEGDDLDILERVWINVPEERRRALMEEIEKLGVQETILSFEALGRFAVMDESPQVRTLAVQTLWEYESPELIDIFLDLLRVDQDPLVRAAAASGLGSFILAGELDKLSLDAQRRIEDQLIQVARQGGTSLEQQCAVESLGYSGRAEVNELIGTAYRTSEPEWVACALTAMGHSANERWNEHVLEMLENKAPRIRMAAVWAAGELAIKSAVPTLLELLEDPHEGVRRNTIWALSQIGGEGVRQVLEHLSDEAESDEELEILEAALENLEFTEGMPVMPFLDVPEGDDSYYPSDYDEEDEWD